MSLISLDQARDLLLEDVQQLAAETVALDDALGRTLAEPVVAAHTQPLEPRATMDGIAVAAIAPVVGDCWTLTGEALAGAPATAPLGPGEAVRIATGGVVPKDATRVLPQEILNFTGDSVTLASEPGSAPFIRDAGADFTAGDGLLDGGTVVGPAQIGLIAAANRATVAVVRRPRVAILTAGDELVAPGAALEAGRSVDSASHVLAALVTCWGGEAQLYPILPDRLNEITSALRAAAPLCDIILCIGGASVGKRDLMRPAVATAFSADFRFEGIAVQPGKPCWHARSATAKLLLGLPGNPSSAFVCAHLLLQPLMQTLVGRPVGQELQLAFAAVAIPANGPREQYLRATVTRDNDGRMLVAPVESQDSGLQANLAKAQVLIRRLPHAEALAPGDKVQIVQLSTS
ncbi:MAG: molybdopterin molybdotransferase MoeA [Sphingomicrobium sp.]